jgi:hypothetical protein
MIADIFMKSLPWKLFWNHRHSLALHSPMNENLAE